MLAHRLRRWPSIKTALVKRPVFAGMLLHPAREKGHLWGRNNKEGCDVWSWWSGVDYISRNTHVPTPSPNPFFLYKLRYIVSFGLVEAYDILYFVPEYDPLSKKLTLCHTSATSPLLFWKWPSTRHVCVCPIDLSASLN